jgi:hypothetical protein
MSYRAINDNLYPEGTLVRANVNPAQQLVIVKYLQRIYYCVVVGSEHEKQKAYFERELTPADSFKK